MEEKKKCGILTINVSLMNYGNRLQNYALQQILIKLGFSPYTINYTPTYTKFSYINSSQVITKKNCKEKTNDRVNLIKRRIFFLRNRAAERKKRKGYENFIQTKIIWTKERYSMNSDFSQLEIFDYMIAGSDQVWNPFWEGTQPIYFMGFISEQKRIAYAASFGVSDIPQEMVDQYKEYLEAIPNISCREDQGCEIVKDLIGRRTVQVLDPVFLLEQNEWVALEERPKCFRERAPYILVYFLGDLSEKSILQIKTLKKIYGFSIVYLDRKEKLGSIFASPTEFLYLVNHAAIVCTDSFHGCAFSIVFNKPFVCFHRSLDNGKAQNMSSRLTSLFRMLKCDRYNSVLSNEEMGHMDYTKINEIIREEKVKSIRFLANAMNV